MKKIWIKPKEVPESVERNLAEFTPLQQQLLFMRGISSLNQANEFLDAEAYKGHDPFRLQGMKKAVARIEQALGNKEKIVIYGDYDVDGVTSTALLMEVISDLGGRVDYYIPDRFKEGYGLNKGAIETIAEKGAALLITVDCGMRAVEEIDLAGALGMDVIVTDHHGPGEILPKGLAVINPKQEGNEYPFLELAGVGLAFKLAQAVHQNRGMKELDYLLDLVALGTVADMAILQDENRSLVARGIKQLRATKRVGLKELARVGRINLEKTSAGTIGFVLGPRLNAAGRLGSAESALNLLMTNDKQKAEGLAEKLDLTNRKRQDLTSETVEKAIQIAIEEEEIPALLFAADETFNEGVVGLGASRLVDKFYRPALVCNRSGKFTRGSARSIPGFHIANAIDRCADLLIKYGGHARAAGFTLHTENEEAFHSKLRKIAEDELDLVDLKPELNIDAEVKLSQLNSQLLEFIERIEPCGEGNKTPVMVARNTRILAKRAVGMDGKHLKMTLGQMKRSMDAIAFRMGELVEDIPSRIDVAFNFERNEFMGIESMQMNILDIHW